MTPLEFPVPSASPNYRLSLLCLLIIKAALMAYVLMHTGIGLGPDEAQYWTWSRQLDWGYYSKPPAIAWQIALGTHFFGDTEFGVRFSSLIIGFLLPWTTYYLAVQSGLKSSTAFWAGAAMALSPLGILASFLATTDGGYILFFTLGLAVLVGAIHRDVKPNYPLIGCWILLGALFKWNIYLLWIIVAVAAFYFTHLRTRSLLLGILISSLGLLPSLWWNVSHDWSTFRHVWSTNIVGEKASAVLNGNFFDFLGAQISLLSPIFFVLFVLAAWTMRKKPDKVPTAIAFCGYTALGTLLIYLAASIFKKMQGNWAAFAYPPAIVFLCWYTCEWLISGKPLLFLGSVLSALLTAFVLSIPSIQASEEEPLISIPYGINPFKHNLGWHHLEHYLRSAGYDPEDDFLFSSKYQTTSILSFYSESQKTAYFFNLNGNRKNQFSYWPGMPDKEVGKEGFYLEVEDRKQVDKPFGPKARAIRAKLRPYFRQVQFLGRKTLFEAYGKPVKTVLIFRCVDYNGLQPEDPEKY